MTRRELLRSHGRRRRRRRGGSAVRSASRHRSIPTSSWRCAPALVTCSILPGTSTRVWRFTGEVLKGPPQSLRGDPRLVSGTDTAAAEGAESANPVHECAAGAVYRPLAWHGHAFGDGRPSAFGDRSPSRFHLRVRGDEPGRHVLVSPASAQSHRTAGLQRTRRSAARVRRRGTRAEFAERPAGDPLRAPGSELRRGQPTQIHFGRHDGARRRGFSEIACSSTASIVHRWRSPRAPIACAC